MENNNPSTYERFVTTVYNHIPIDATHEELLNIFNLLRINGLEMVLSCPVPNQSWPRTMCAMAIRILNEQVKRLLDICFLERLPYTSDTPITLLQNCWPELLVLGMWPFRPLIPFDNLLLEVRKLVRQEQIGRANGAAQRQSIRRHACRISGHPPKMTPEELLDQELDEMDKTLLYIHIFYLTIDALGLTLAEQIYLMWFCLFSPHGVSPNIAGNLVSLQTQLLDSLVKSAALPSAGMDNRRMAFILLLPMLKNLSKPFMKALFFSPNCSTININTVIENLFQFERVQRRQNYLIFSRYSGM